MASNIRKTKEKFMLEANEKHNNYYDYSKVEYINSYTKVCIICPKHGEFWQKPSIHIKGSDCPKCSIERQRINKKQFIEKAIRIHGDKYNYTKVEYINYETKVCIICPEHGEFWQEPANHLSGQGCPKCNESKGERKIRIWLEKNNITFVSNKPCLEWLVNNKGNRLKPDFYLPNFNIIIEFDGRQHFEPVRYIGMTEQEADLKFEIQVLNDNYKNKLCEEHNFNLVRIPYTEFDRVEEILNESVFKEKINKWEQK